MRRSALLAVILLVGATCSRQPRESSVEPEPTTAARWHYEVSIERDATRADVTLCFDQPPTSPLVATDPTAAASIERPRDVRTGRDLPRTGNAISLASVAAGDCIFYSVDFVEMERRAGTSRKIQRLGASVAARVSMWLWHPAVLPDDLEATLRLHLPDGVQASLPWPLDPTADPSARQYILDRTSFTWFGTAAFGRLAIERFQAADSTIELAVLDAPFEPTPAGLRAWISDAAASVALLYGRFPRDRLQVIVYPINAFDDGSVYFGMAMRGGGPGVILLMNAHADEAQLPGGWTTVHEFLHHGMPFVDDAWMAEGWVSYYTEVMRTRMGHRDESMGWQKLYDAFQRGRRTSRGGSLQGASDHMHRTFAYQRVYWGGAAIAFLTDVALRRDSGGTRSLDDAMRELRRCCGDADHDWPADELLARLDHWYGKPLFSEIAHHYLPSNDFPPIEEGFEALGIHVQDGVVALDEHHPGAAMRRDLMAPQQLHVVDAQEWSH